MSLGNMRLRLDPNYMLNTNAIIFDTVIGHLHYDHRRSFINGTLSSYENAVSSMIKMLFSPNGLQKHITDESKRLIPNSETENTIWQERKIDNGVERWTEDIIMENILRYTTLVHEHYTRFSPDDNRAVISYEIYKYRFKREDSSLYDIWFHIVNTAGDFRNGISHSMLYMISDSEDNLEVPNGDAWCYCPGFTETEPKFKHIDYVERERKAIRLVQKEFEKIYRISHENEYRDFSKSVL